jgi:hypothetical protein
MTYKLSSLLCLLTLCVAGPAAAEPPEPALQGCWNVAIDTPILVPTIRARLKLSIHEQAVSGSLSRDGKQMALRSPSAQGRRVRFAVSGSRGEARFSGTLEGSRLRGNVSSPRGNFSWAASRC